MNEFAGKGKRFAARAYRLRVIGLGIGFFCVASVFVQLRANPLLSALLFCHGFIWPHLAYRFALACEVPYRGEQANIMVDAAFGGLWVVAMRFNVLPSVLIIAMLSMDNIAAGGMRLFARGLVAHCVGAAIGAAALGVVFAPESRMLTVLACIPLVVLYPIALGWTTYRMAQKLAERSRELERLSRTDGLTDVFNRRHWERMLAESFDRCRASGESACLLLFDLDHFKRINDELGHVAGDAVLQGFARFLRQSVREADIVGRYGGEEFGVVLPDTTLAEAGQIVDRLMASVRAQVRDDPVAFPCTASAGLADYRPTMENYHAWLKEADRCLYRAKARGRDRVVVAGRRDHGGSELSVIES